MSKTTLLLFTAAMLQGSTTGFQTPNSYNHQDGSRLAMSTSDDNESATRRSFLTSAGIALAGMGVLPQYASAGIDISGLRVEGNSASNSVLASQLKAFDGSGSARVRDVKEIQQTSAPISKAVSKFEPEDERAPLATWAYRANPGIATSLARAGTFANLYRLNDSMVAPSGSKRRSIAIQLEFPNDWLQLDRQIGGIQYVDQRNGDKLYILRAPLPEGSSLDTVSKSVIGDLIFDVNGSFVKSGQNVEEYKVASAQILSTCPTGGCATRRRFKIKYATLTGNGLRVERRALVDAYQVDNDVYMLMTSSNAVKFEKKDSLERETVESIVSSFQVDV